MENNMTDILDLIASGEASEAKDALNNVLTTKAFQALETKKQELAQALYTNNAVDNNQEVTDDNSVETQENEITEE